MPEGEIVVKVGKLAWDNREGILKALGAIAKWFRGSKSEKGILILGSGGTGKTTLAPLLAGDFDSALNIPGEYEESLETESFKLKGATVEVVVPPGQEFRRDATWTVLCKDVEAGNWELR